MSSSRTIASAACTAALLGCGDEPVDLQLTVSGCAEAEVRLLVFSGEEACATEDPREQDGSTLAPRVDTGWQSRPRAVRIPLPDDGAVSVVAWCRDAAGVVRGWGCASEASGAVDVVVEPTCACLPRAECGEGAAAWSSGAGTLCVERCARCDDADAGPDGGGCAPRGEVVQTLPAEPIGASARALARAGEQLLVANGDAGLAVYGGALEGLAWRDDLDLAAPAVDVAAGSGVAFVATGTPTLFVIDLEPGLALLAEPALEGETLGVAAPPGHALVAAADGGLRLLDVSDPGAPEEVGNHPPTGARALALTAGFAVVVAGTDLSLVDVDDLPSLRGAGSVETAAEGLAVAVDGTGRIAVAEGTAGVETYAIDAASGHLEAASAAPFVTTDARGLAIDGDLLFVADGAAGLSVLDLTELGSPTAVLQVSLPAGSSDAVAVLVEGEWALLAAGESGLHVVHLECLP